MVLLDICIGEAYLVELIAEVYGVDVVALEVGEHDDLLSSPHEPDRPVIAELYSYIQ